MVDRRSEPNERTNQEFISELFERWHLSMGWLAFLLSLLLSILPLLPLLHRFLLLDRPEEGNTK